MLGANVIFCHLCFALACDCGLRYFRRNMMSMSSDVRLLLAFMFLKICRAFFGDVNANSEFSSSLIFLVAS